MLQQIPPTLRIEPLHVSHLDGLAVILRHTAVYAHIEESVPTAAEFKLGLQRALAGPGATRQEEQWLNYLVRDASGEMLGRLEATVHHGLAEVACLFAPKHWGRGIGTTAVHWLQGELARVTDVTAVWATTAPSNVRSQRLLDRCGYERASAPSSLLYSYESGDLVYRRQFAFQRQVGADGKA